MEIGSRVRVLSPSDEHPDDNWDFEGTVEEFLGSEVPFPYLVRKQGEETWLPCTEEELTLI